LALLSVSTVKVDVDLDEILRLISNALNLVCGLTSKLGLLGQFDRVRKSHRSPFQSSLSNGTCFYKDNGKFPLIRKALSFNPKLAGKSRTLLSRVDEIGNPATPRMNRCSDKINRLN
jgi:hypothetical protein